MLAILDNRDVASGFYSFGFDKVGDEGINEERNEKGRVSYRILFVLLR